MANHDKIYVVCDDETDEEFTYFTDHDEAISYSHRMAPLVRRDLYVDTRDGSLPLNLTCRAAEEDEMERAMQTVRLSDLARRANHVAEFHAILGLARDLARDYLFAGAEIPASVANAALTARKALGMAA